LGIKIETIGFDADDTLWLNETLYLQAKQDLITLLSPYQEPELIESYLDKTELSNIRVYGYGIKSFTLSMIETALELSHGTAGADEIQQVISFARRMLSSDVQLLEGVQETLARLAIEYDLMMITKGDLFEQERKVERSGLAKYFKYIEYVGEKTPHRYQTLFVKYALDPAGFLMVGNSLRSDILPVISIGGRAVYIPYQHTWSHETDVGTELDGRKFYQIENISQLPDLLHDLSGRG
jgi:putative hydrolase of the HAD superfamily